MTGKITYTLKYPVTITLISPEDGEKEETVSIITLRRPTAKDMRITDGITGEVAKSLALIGELSGLGRQQVDKLDVADMVAIGEIIEDFIAPGPKTGATS